MKMAFISYLTRAITIPWDTSSTKTAMTQLEASMTIRDITSIQLLT